MLEIISCDSGTVIVDEFSAYYILTLCLTVGWQVLVKLAALGSGLHQDVQATGKHVAQEGAKAFDVLYGSVRW